MRRHSRGRRAPAATPNPPSGAASGTDAVGTAGAEDARTVVSGYRLLRRVASGDRATIYLASSVHPSEEGSSSRAVVALRIYEAGADDARVAAEISAMTADATGTLPAIVDVTALDDGRCVLAVERIPGPTLARLLTERVLEPGEAVTILAPIAVAVAGLAEAGFVQTRLALNDVLIDGSGRPRLIGLGAIRRLDEVSSAIERTELLRAGHAALAALVAAVAAATRPSDRLGRAVAAIQSAAAARPFVRSEAMLERMLFESAAAVPVQGVRVSRPGSAPVRVTEAGATGVAAAAGGPESFDGPGEPTTAGGAARPSRRGLLATLAVLAQVPADAVEHGGRLADLAPVTSLASRLRRALVARRRPVLVAALAGGAALILLLTLVPPAGQSGAHGADGEAAAGRSGESAGDPGAGSGLTGAGEAPPGATADGVSGSAPAEPEPVVADDTDPIQATAGLLEQRERCFAELDAACLEQVDQSDSAIERADQAALSGAREGAALEPVAFALESISVVAEMGDAVLMTVAYVDPEREPASLLVMRGEAGWRLRELFD